MTWRFRRTLEFASLLRHLLKFGELIPHRSSEVMLYCGDGNRGYVYSGKQYAQLLDSINDRLIEDGINTLTIASPNSAVVGPLAYGNVVAVNGLLARATILHKLKRLLPISREFQNDPLVVAWRCILTKVQPAAIIGIWPSSELCIAARMHGIWVADLQHGIMTDEDHSYYGPKYRKRYNQAGWPDCVLCWDEISANWLYSQIGNGVEARVIGNPWLLRFLAPREGDTLVRSAERSAMKKTDKHLTILVTLQPGLDRVGPYHDIGMPSGLADLIKGQKEDCTWWIRVHPTLMHDPYRQKAYRRLEQEFGRYKNVSWIECSEAPLPVVLRKTDLHITSHSFVTLEASWFGIRTALLYCRKELLYKWLGQQIGNGSADVVAADPEAIGHWIANNKKYVGTSKTPRYMSPVALDRFIREISDRVDLRRRRDSGTA